MTTAAESWMTQVCRRHGLASPDGSVTVALSQAALAAEAGVSAGTVSAYLSSLERRGLVLSRRPLRFVDVQSTSRADASSDHDSAPSVDDPIDSVRVLLAGLLAEPGAGKNPWAGVVADGIRILTGAPPVRAVPRTQVADSRDPRASPADSRGLKQDKTRPDSSMSPSESRAKGRGFADRPRGSARPGGESKGLRGVHPAEKVEEWVAQLQSMAEVHGCMVPGRLDHLLSTFDQFTEAQVQRALAKVELDVASGKVFSPVGVLVAAGREPSTRLEYFGRSATAKRSDPAPTPPPVEFAEVYDEDGNFRGVSIGNSS